ncbi:MAG TPA: Ldh family oxidoreductase [Candidatus Dormibacteraeota bacterium]|nr:Ldh family oxidoreductase [Candidatus Dormibacteraeota bacterium]
MSETAKPAPDHPRIGITELKRFVTRALESVGIPPEDATQVAALMAEADARGGDAHGVFRLPQYVKQIQSRGINSRPNIRILSDRVGTALLDGDNALGHLVMKRAAELAIEKARHSGIGWVGTRRSNHAGPAQLYARMPAAQDMIGLYFCVGNANLLPPWGGTEVLLSTNPIAIAVPALQHPSIVLDMATTNTAFGKIRLKAQRNEPMPEGWMIDRQGQPMTDPKRASEGFLVPIGGPKGYGLALMIGLLAGTLNGAAFGRDVVDYTTDSKTASNTGQSIVAVDIAMFADVQAFKQKVDELWEVMKSSPTLPGVDEVRLPGERSEQLYRDRMALGVPLGAELRKVLEELADRLGIQRMQ